MYKKYLSEIGNCLLQKVKDEHWWSSNDQKSPFVNWPMEFVPHSTILRDIVKRGTNSIGQ